MARELTLFDDIQRTDHWHSKRARSSFDFLNTSAWPACHNMRDRLEQWFERYPDSSKNDLRARFRKRDHNHGSAFFELFLHEVFSRLGLSPEVHPESQRGHGRPDFAITSGSDALYYVEANVVGRKGIMAEDSLENDVLDAIDSLAVERPTSIALRAQTSGRLAQSLRTGPIKAKVQKWVDQIDRDFINPGWIEAEPLEVSHGEWGLTLTAYRRTDRPSHRLLHVGPGRVGMSTDDTDLRKNILTKTKQHRDIDRPLIIAINRPGTWKDREDEVSALFGKEQLSWQVDEHGNAVTPTTVSRASDSVWRNRTGSRYSRLHGVLFFRGAWPQTAHSVTSHLYVNPFIQADVPDELLRLGSARVRNGEMQWEPGFSLGDLLDLPEDWPGERTSSFSAD